MLVNGDSRNEIDETFGVGAQRATNAVILGVAGAIRN